ncbi:tetratricopeptide repeat-containing sensor histidine kinase [Flagellimonas sp. S174]|uniref:tetratricopeptide repeat-containing sensor histidine kinase n=1 Tax=Flagellimonas sp. S174 TaxID=3410790 RepID=UPI003BF5000A
MERRASVISTIAERYLESGNGDSVIHYASMLNKTLEDIPNPNTSDLILKNRLEGDGKYLKGLYDGALKVYLEGISLDSTKNQHKETQKCLLGVGRVYLAKGQLDKSSEVILECTQSPEIAAEAFLLLGVIHYVKKDFKNSRKYYNAALERIENEVNPKLKQRVQLNLGRLEEVQGNHEKAFGIYEEIIKSSIQSSYYDLYTEAVVQYGQLATALGHFDQAEMTLSMAYTNAIQWNRLELQKRIVNGLRKTYQQKGDYQNAYNLMTHYVRVSNEIERQQNSQIVSELEVQYQTLRKENQILELKEEQLQKQNELERQKTIKKAFLYGFLIILIPILALLYVYYQKLQTQSQLNLRMKELNSQKMGALIKENELMLTKTSLKAQQEERRRISQQLHDSIGSNLAGIKLQLANLQDDSKGSNLILDKIDETYQQVRDISHDLIPKKFAQDAFSTLLREYVENITKSSNVQFEFSVFPEEAVDTLSEVVKIEIYAIVQELVTNTIKHADAKSIELHINLDGNILNVLYEDDGIGFDTSKTAKGIGLSNIEDRLSSLSGNLNIDSIINRGTAITIEIPIQLDAA